MFGALAARRHLGRTSTCSTPTTLDYYLADCTPSVLIYNRDHLPTIQRHRAAARSVQHYICMDGPQEGALSWPELLASSKNAEPPDVSDLTAPISPIPRARPASPRARCSRTSRRFRACRCIAERLGYSASDVTYGPSTLSSSYHLVANLIPGLYAGATVGVVSKWSAAKGWDDMERLGSTVLPTNATVLAEVLEECRRRGRPPRALRLGVTGGGPTPPTLKKAWRDELKITLAESFGQSELGGFRRPRPAHAPAAGRKAARLRAVAAEPRSAHPRSAERARGARRRNR